ncbi:kinase-like domain-containing protein [Microdochium bolleyi]|uniref:Kinase-like domain-containing protein n=1 Tax=Microdochium bolleyi TaxID=196109 RepID=A0A136J7L1_9PEZI|nr:kinase-like domain-containing protein [Microdochium bolleyi]
MAVSPVVAYPSDALQPQPTQHATGISSPLKLVSSAQASSNGTPLPSAAQQGPAPTSAPSLAAATLDLAEQLNEEEKRKYFKGKKLGEGTYANVYFGYVRSDPSQLVAIKKIKIQKEYTEGMAPDAVREIKHLQELKHPNIISLHSVFSSKDQNLNLVLEYLPLGDLEMLIRDDAGIRYGSADIKAWMGMLTRAVWFCHDNFVLHRDIKPNNLLIAGDGEVKLADFGLARSFSDPYIVMTSNVITRWYRPPELLFGARHYSGAVDVWSVGCVFAELVLRTPFLAGETEMQQISLICKAIGTPTDDNWPGVSKLPEYTVDKEVYPVRTRSSYMEMFPTIGAEGVDLLMKTLALDPKKRITARDMLLHEWWHKEPRPTRKRDLPRKQSGSEEKLAADLKRRPGVVDEESRGAKVSRKLDFGGAL